MHTALLQRWTSNNGKFPEQVDGEYLIPDSTTESATTIAIKSEKVKEFHKGFPHLLVVTNHEVLKTHCLFVTKQYVPNEGGYKGVEVYKCDDDWKSKEKEKQFHEIPVTLSRNILYKVNITTKPFTQKCDENQCKYKISD